MATGSRKDPRPAKTADAVSDSADADEAIQVTVMALREEIMRYFKGTCVDRVTKNRNIKLDMLEAYGARGEFQYLRRQRERERRCHLKLGGLPIATLQHAPDTLTINVKVLDRSPQLREVRKELEKFMERFLLGVDIKYNEGVVLYG